MSKKHSHESNDLSTALNLGLQDLMEENQAAAGEGALSAEVLGNKEAEQAETESLSEDSLYDRMARDQKWNEILKLSEANFTAGDTPYEKTWWILAHLRAQSMPASFLAAPLESVINSYQSSHRLKEHFLLKVVEEFVLLLKAGGALELCESITTAASAKGLSLKVSAQEGVIQKPPVASLANTRISEGRKEERRTVFSFSKFLFALLLLFPVLIVGGFFLYDSKSSFSSFFAKIGESFSSQKGVVSNEPFVSEVVSATVLPPEVSPKSVSGSLSAIYYSMDDPSQSSDPKKENPTDKELEAAPQEVISKSSLEKVNTTGPKEPADFGKRRDSSSQDDSGQKNGERSPFGDGSKPEVYEHPGPEKSKQPSPIPHQRTPLGRSNAEIFTVISPTVVTSEPNYQSPVLGRLAIGDSVSIDAYFGRFARVRSARGRIGFVLLEDLARAEFPPR